MYLFAGAGMPPSAMAICAGLSFTHALPSTVKPSAVCSLPSIVYLTSYFVSCFWLSSFT